MPFWFAALNPWTIAATAAGFASVGAYIQYLRGNGDPLADLWDGKDEKIYSLEELGLGNQDGDVRTVMEDGYEFTEVYNQNTQTWNRDYSYIGSSQPDLGNATDISAASQRVRTKLKPKPVVQETNQYNLEVANTLKPDEAHVRAYNLAQNQNKFAQLPAEKQIQVKEFIDVKQKDQISVASKVAPDVTEKVVPKPLLNEVNVVKPDYTNYNIKSKDAPIIKTKESVNVQPKDVNPRIRQVNQIPDMKTKTPKEVTTKTFTPVNVAQPYDGSQNAQYRDSRVANRITPASNTKVVDANALRSDEAYRTPAAVQTNASQMERRNMVGAESTTAQPNLPNNPPPGMMEGREYEANTKNSEVEVQTPDEQVENKKTETATKNKKFNVKHKPPGENVLYPFAPYTYDARLSALSHELYADNDLKLASNNNVIMRSSGLGRQNTDTPKRSGKGKGPSRSQQRVKKSGGEDQINSLAPGSQLNKHFGQITLNSVIGLNSKTNVSNIHGLSFEVFEPYATSLLDDLHDAAVSLGHVNYLQAPFLLTIDFHGMDDNGMPTTAITTRYFPIKIINCDFNVTGAGTTYNFSAVPWNASTMNDNVKYLQDTVNLEGGSVGELLQSLEQQLNDQFASADERRNYEIRGGRNRSERRSSVDLMSSGIGHGKNTPLKSAYSLELTPDGKKYVQNLQAGLQSSESAQKQADAGKQYTASDLVGVEGNLTKRVYTYNKGTAITSIIESIVESSDYITRQVNDPEEFVQGMDGSGRTPWYNIDYKFTIKDDNIPYYSFFVYQYMVDASNVVNTTTLKQYFNKPIARKYEYIYTGENRDILNFDIQYNFAFFQALQDLPQSQQSKSKTESSIQTKKVTAVPVVADTLKVENTGGKTPTKSERSISDKSNSSAGTESSGEDRDKLSIIKDVLTRPEADLINLDLEILGDPYYLQQTDFSIGDYGIDESTPFTLNDGSIYDKEGEVYINITFKTPVDLDQETGLMSGLQGAGKYETAFFSGVFRVIGVESVMSQGQFTQNLTLVRLKNQEEPQVETRPEAGVEGEAGEVQKVVNGVQTQNKQDNSAKDDGSNQQVNSSGYITKKEDGKTNEILNNNSGGGVSTSEVSGLTTNNAGLDQIYNPLSPNQGIGDTYGPAGSSVATTTNEYQNIQYDPNAQSPTDKKTASQRSDSFGDLNEDGTVKGATEAYQENYNEKYGGLSREEFYNDARGKKLSSEGKKLFRDGLTKEEYYKGYMLFDDGTIRQDDYNVYTRQLEKIAEEGEATGLSKSEIRKKQTDYKVSVGAAEYYTTSSGKQRAKLTGYPTINGQKAEPLKNVKVVGRWN